MIYSEKYLDRINIKYKESIIINLKLPELVVNDKSYTISENMIINLIKCYIKNKQI